MERVMINVRTKASDLERYGYMQSLHERNEHLFYKVGTPAARHGARH